MNQDIPTDAFEYLGLTTYETRVFVALQRLQTGTAREIAAVSDVPRSQVYETAASLADQGLVEAQQADPRRYQSVDLSEARARFQARYEDAEAEAFEFLEAVESTRVKDSKSPADIWTIEGRENVEQRIQSLVEEAEESILYGVRTPDRLTESTAAALEAKAAEGTTVTGLSANPAAVEQFDTLTNTRTFLVDSDETTEQYSGRVLIVDQEAVLLSILGYDDAGCSSSDEAAIWSRESGFATVLIQLLDSWFDETVTL
jgi:sugar-specific transcriptional regulator TrmB